MWKLICSSFFFADVCKACVCNHWSMAQPAASSLASSFCSGNQQDLMVATSILNAFCLQLPSVTTYVPVPVVTEITSTTVQYVTPVTTVTRSSILTSS